MQQQKSEKWLPQHEHEPESGIEKIQNFYESVRNR